MSDLGGVFLTVGLLAANAFFVGAEFALISARRSQIEPRAQAGSRVAVMTLDAMERVSTMMAGAQLGITICSVLLGAVGEPAIAHLLEPVIHLLHVPEGLLHPISFVIAMSLVVYLHVVLGEMVPKNLAIAGPERAALVLGPPMVAIAWLLTPVLWVLNGIANLSLRLLRVQPQEEISSSYTREEVAQMVEESHGEGLLRADEYDLLSGALGFTENTVASVLMPLDTLTTIDVGATPEQVEEVVAETGFSRFPVRRPDDGELLGYLHIKDVLETDPERRARPIEAKWLRSFASVRDGDVLHDALEILQRRGAHLARVIDADGAVLGLISMEDVLEELVGEIRDAAHHSDHPTDQHADAL